MSPVVGADNAVFAVDIAVPVALVLVTEFGAKVVPFG
jgi:hypothetical protein